MNQNKSTILKFFKANGFYVVLIICVLAAGVSSYLAVDTLMTQVTPEVGQDILDPSDDFLSQEANAEQSDVPITEQLRPDDEDDEQQTEESQAQPQSTEKPQQSEQGESAQSSPAALDQPTTEQATALPQESNSAPTAVETPSFVMPVNGNIIKEFSEDELVFNATMADWRTHNGVDLSAQLGDTVVSSTMGVVVDTYLDDMWGGVVEVSTDDMLIRYTGLDSHIEVKKDQQVNVGDIIGKVGELPCEMSDPPHIHVEVIKDDEYICLTTLQ